MPAAEIASALAQAAAPVAANLLRSYGRRKYDELIASYTNLLDDFLKVSLHKCSTVKTLLNSDSPISLHDIYVDGMFSNGQIEINGETLRKKIETETGAFAVTGLGGSGKSMFLKYAVHELIVSMPHHQRIPLFVEIRDLDLAGLDRGLEDIIFYYCSSPDNRSSLEQFKAGLRAGLFIIAFDGIDEAPATLIDKLLFQLDRFYKDYRQCTIVATTRPGTRLANLSHFRVFAVKDMSLNQVVEVVQKAPYDPDRKSILIESLKDGLYVTHQSFLSNPLLVTIVLITFDDASRIPGNLTGFYSAAFDALFNRHDWSKGVYIRQHRSGLEKSSFEKIFTLFCYRTYLKSMYIFEHDELISLIQEAIVGTKHKVAPVDFVADCILAVCLLQVDEPKVMFVHRSFQEYFTAKFVSSYTGPKLFDILDLISSRSLVDNTFLMASQLNKEAVCRTWGSRQAGAMLVRWKQAIGSGDFHVIFRDAGVTQLSVTIETGYPVGMTVEHLRGYATINAIMLLADNSLGTMFSGPLSTPLYPEGGFSGLSDSVRRKIALSASGKSVDLDLTEAAIEEYNGILFSDFAVAIFDAVEKAKEEIDDFLEQRDEIASIDDLADLA